MTTAEIEINYCPHDGQELIHYDDARFKVIVCGRRWGKTTLAINELIKCAMAKDNSYLWLCSPTYRQSKMIAWRMLKQYIPDEIPVKYNESELAAIFPNGSVIELKGADNEDALRGAGLDGLVVDEFASIYDNWSVWNEVLRPALTDKKGWVIFIGTPKGKDAFWELYMKGQRGESGFKSWQFKTTENPIIDPEEVEQARKSVPERYFRQEYEASFEDFVGLIYPEFSENHHVIPSFDIPENWNRYCSIDPAISGTSAVLFGAVENETLYIYDEYYEKDVRVGEVAQAIKERGVMKQHYIDPASKINTQRTAQGKLYSIYDEFAEYGIHPQIAENAVEAGINRVAEKFKSLDIKIFKNCTNLIWEIERYHYAESKETAKGMTKSEPYKKDDHLVDNLRYLIMSRPGGISAEPKKAPRLSVAWMEEREAEKDDWRSKY